jgi:preprotein translocase subunit YajC
MMRLMRVFDGGSVFAMGMALDGSGPLAQLVLFAVIIGIFYFIVLLPAKRKQQKVQEFLDHLKVNDKVITTGGIWGLITKLDDQAVTLEVADKVRIKVSRAAIGGLQGQPPVVDTPQT